MSNVQDENRCEEDDNCDIDKDVELASERGNFE